MKKTQTVIIPDSTHTGKLFRTLRYSAALSQEEAAEKLDCATIQRYEAGDTTPDYPTLLRMRVSYNCEAAVLFPPLFPSGKKTG